MASRQPALAANAETGLCRSLARAWSRAGMPIAAWVTGVSQILARWCAKERTRSRRKIQAAARRFPPPRGLSGRQDCQIAAVMKLHDSRPGKAQPVFLHADADPVIVEEVQVVVSILRIQLFPAQRSRKRVSSRGRVSSRFGRNRACRKCGWARNNTPSSASRPPDPANVKARSNRQAGTVHPKRLRRSNPRASLPRAVQDSHAALLLAQSRGPSQARQDLG